MVWPPVRRTLTPGMIVASSSTSCSTPASASGTKLSGQIARAVARVRMGRILPLAAADDVLRARKCRTDGAAGVAVGEAAGMIEVQMGGEDDVDVLAARCRPRPS